MLPKNKFTNCEVSSKLHVIKSLVQILELLLLAQLKTCFTQIETFDEKKSSTSALLMLTPCSLKAFIIVFDNYDADHQDDDDDDDDGI